jgi:AraC-like DNA-binding protein
MGIAYMDSMLIAIKQYEEQFDSILLLRMEQKESVKQQQELVREKEKLHQSQLRLLILFAGFIIIIGLLVVISLQYRIKNAAYRELVRKSQEWAQNYKEETKTEHSISEVDQQLFEQLQQMFQLEHLFREPTISVDDIAQRMKVNRTYLSRAVNHCTGKNFNVYINEYRIREAVRLMSNNFHKLSLEGLAFEVGFNDRKTFYTAFRKITGLSPSEFRSNMQEV